MPLPEPPVPAGPRLADLRRAALAVSVLHDVELGVDDGGVVLPGRPPLRLDWDECRTALGGEDPDDELGQIRLREWLRVRRWAADLTARELRARLAPAGLPCVHPLHPGDGWVRERVLGDALVLGLSAQGLDPADPDAVHLVPPPALVHAGIDPADAWPQARVELERLGGVAARRLRLDPQGVLRPLGAADAVTLLGARTLRAELAAAHGGLAAAVLPMRRRGWTRLHAVDPAFGPAAAAATSPADRGFPRPVLVTADEVVMVAEGGRPQDSELREPAHGLARPHR